MKFDCAAASGIERRKINRHSNTENSRTDQSALRDDADEWPRLIFSRSRSPASCASAIRLPIAAQSPLFSSCDVHIHIYVAVGDASVLYIRDVCFTTDDNYGSHYILIVRSGRTRFINVLLRAFSLSFSCSLVKVRARAAQNNASLKRDDPDLAKRSLCACVYVVCTPLQHQQEREKCVHARGVKS